MNDKNFDQHLKSVLENLEPDFDPTSWAMLERKMNAAIVEEQPAAVDEVDKAVYHTLNRLEAPYQQAHWNLLAKRMQVQTIRLRRLRVAKIAEAAILLLFLWNTESYWGETKFFTPPAPRFDPDVPVAQMDPTKRPGLTARQHTASTAANTPILLEALQNSLAQPGAPNLLGDDYKEAGNVATILTGLGDLAAEARRNLYAGATDFLPFDAAFAPLAIPNRDATFLVVPVDHKRAGKKGAYLAVYVGADQNRVLVNSERQINMGHSAAFSAGFRPNKWGVEAGVGYAHKRYAPHRDVKIYSGNTSDGYVGSAFTEVDADMLTFPLKATRRIARVGKTTAHAVAGVTAHVALEKNYDYGSVHFPANTLPPNFLPDPNQSPQLRQTGKGILEKGKLRDNNFYATADAGIRIEHPIGNGRHTAFVEPMYRHALGSSGIGLKREPISTVSIQAGVLTYL